MLRDELVDLETEACRLVHRYMKRLEEARKGGRIVEADVWLRLGWLLGVTLGFQVALGIEEARKDFLQTLSRVEAELEDVFSKMGGQQS